MGGEVYRQGSQLDGWVAKYRLRTGIAKYMDGVVKGMNGKVERRIAKHV